MNTCDARRDAAADDVRTSPLPAAPNGANGAVGGAADWLGLAPAPIFAAMALLAGGPGSGPDMLCGVAREASPLGGMVPMYVLMSAFHAAPWFRLIFARSPVIR